jgi:ABC-type polysaccharide/polyol phosphate export permease
LLASLEDLWRHRALIGVLTARELKARYRGSVLGFFWSLLNPLLMLVVYAVVFQVVFPNRSASTRPYALFLFVGLLPWNWLAGALTDSASSLPTHGALLRKVLFPAEVLPTVSVLAQGVHFVLALPVLLLALVAGAAGLFDAPVPLGAPLLQVPLLLALEALLLLGVGFFLAALTVHFRDVKDLLGTALSLWFFATPVLYSLKDLDAPRLKSLLRWNPVAPLFTAWHDALFYGRWVSPATWGTAALVSLAAFLLGYGVFDRLRDSYAEAV